jgi:hypothetical protein
MRADSTERHQPNQTLEPNQTLDSHRTPDPFHFSSYYPPRVEARTPALRQAEQAVNTATDPSPSNSFEKAKDPSGLPKLEIHLDYKINNYHKTTFLFKKP